MGKSPGREQVVDRLQSRRTGGFTLSTNPPSRVSATWVGPGPWGPPSETKSISLLPSRPGRQRLDISARSRKETTHRGWSLSRGVSPPLFPRVGGDLSHLPRNRHF